MVLHSTARLQIVQSPPALPTGEMFPGLSGAGDSRGSEPRETHSRLAGSPGSCSAEGADSRLRICQIPHGGSVGPITKAPA